jgi:hypothetical protein
MQYTVSSPQMHAEHTRGLCIAATVVVAAAAADARCARLIEHRYKELGDRAAARQSDHTR